MFTTLDRRAFLRRAAATWGAASGALAMPTAHRAQAIEPIRRQFGAKFKFSLAAYSFRKLLTAKPPQMSLEEFIDTCAKLQLDGTELTSYYFAEQTREYLQHLKQYAFLAGLDISGTAIRNDFCLAAGPARDRQIAAVKRWIDSAEILGAPVIRIFSGQAKRGMTTDEATRLAVTAIEECCQYAGDRGIYLALENHGGLTATHQGMLEIVRAVKSPWFGVNLDTGNFHTDDPYGGLAKIAPYAVNVQIKVAIHTAGQEQQRADLPRLAGIVRDAGYRGYIVLEYEADEDPHVACAPYIEELRQAFRE